ncbi:serine protease FAM111A-like isoform X2 [Enoplosus armatus]
MWQWDDKKPTTITCNKARTVEDLLKTSSQFREIAEKNKNKELVIIKEGKAISSHFPCSLIKNELLKVKYVKAVDKLVSGSVHPPKKKRSGELVMFHVMMKGDDNVVKIMRNLELEKYTLMTVYAYKGEKVKKALKGDGRLQDKVFTKNCALCNTDTDVKTEMSSLVEDLDGKSFKIILLNKSSPPESQPSSLDDADVMQNESQRADSDVDQDPPQQSSTTESVNDNNPKEEPKLNNNMALGTIVCEMPNSETMQRHLSSQFKDLLKGMKTHEGSKLSHIQNLFRVEYGKSVETCMEVKTMKKLMDLSNSVCQVRINERPGGSGFLLFDKFVLTNGHVVSKIYDLSTGQLNEKVTVHFSHESLDQTEGAEVEEVAGFEHYLDVSQHEHDWALLKLGADQKLPDGLLSQFGFLPPSGGICIMGHPDGGVKKIDPCLIIPTDNRNQVVEKQHHENPKHVWVEGSEHSLPPKPIQLVTHCFFEEVAKFVEQRRQVLTYETCFYFGSSGSPVFDDHCNVVAMHTGGYVYYNARGQRQSVIEFGHPLSVIIEHIIVQIVEKGKFNVLKDYLACSYKHQQKMKTSLKKLVESRNLTAFKDAVNNSVVTNDESLKAFFEFLCQREEPVPMDLD